MFMSEHGRFKPCHTQVGGTSPGNMVRSLRSQRHGPCACQRHLGYRLREYGRQVHAADGLARPRVRQHPPRARSERRAQGASTRRHLITECMTQSVTVAADTLLY